MINNSVYHQKGYDKDIIRTYTPRKNAKAKNVKTNIITVFEHQRLTAHDFLHVSDLQWLMAQEFVVFTIKRKQGQWQLKVGHYIGIILLPSGMTLELLPKLNTSIQDDDIAQTRRWVQGMLSDLTHLDRPKSCKLPNMKNLGQFAHPSVRLPIEAPPLSDWLIAQFLQRLVHYQPTQHYQERVQNQSSVQGRLLIKEQLRRNSTQPHRFVCESSMLSHDMLANRLIKSALVYLMPLFLQSRYSTLLQQWQHLPTLDQREIQRLASTYTQATKQLDTLPLQRQKLQAAHQLLDLAYWLLRQSTAAAGYGVDSTKPNQPQLRLCLLIDMNQAFEQWASQRIVSMFQRLSNHCRPLYQTQSVWLNDAEGRACLSIRPDLLIYQTSDNHYQGQSDTDQNDRAVTRTTVTKTTMTKTKGRYSHVIDIKWKYLPHSNAISASDAYQLTSYAQAYQAEQVWMVYPVLGDERQPVALKQQIHQALDTDNGDGSSDAHLWLIPFDVLTGTVNGNGRPHLSRA